MRLWDVSEHCGTRKRVTVIRTFTGRQRPRCLSSTTQMIRDRIVEPEEQALYGSPAGDILVNEGQESWKLVGASAI